MTDHLDPRVPLTEEARRSLELAGEEAQRLGHQHLGTEHVLLGLLMEGEGLAAHVLLISGVSLDEARAQVEPTAVDPRPTSAVPRSSTSHLARALELAVLESVEAGTLVVEDRHLLLGILRERQGAAVDVLMTLGVDLARLASRARSIVSKEIPEILQEDPSEPPAPPPPTLRIFISYRRQETRHLAGRLHDRLAGELGEAQVFMDVVSIRGGDDFVAAIERAVGSCDVLLCLIGPGWAAATDEAGHRRLEDPRDVVRRELEAAFARDIRVVPVLVDGASMPRQEDLSPSLARLVGLQAALLRHDSFRDDVRRLVETLRAALDDPD